MNDATDVIGRDGRDAQSRLERQILDDFYIRFEPHMTRSEMQNIAGDVRDFVLEQLAKNGEHEALTAEIAALRAEREWIKVSERLPDTVRLVWITLNSNTNDPATAEGYWDTAKWMLLADGEHFVQIPKIYTVTAWKERITPKPFTDSNEEKTDD